MGGLRIKRVLTLSLGLVAWLVVPSPNAGAATLIVTTTADENGSGAGCALREAIRSANENTAVGGCSAGTVGPDAITVPAGTYGLSVGGLGEDAAAMGDLDITEDLTINGAGARTTTVNAGQLDRVFDVLPTVGTASMNDLTITGGKGKPSHRRTAAAASTSRTQRSICSVCTSRAISPGSTGEGSTRKTGS